MDTCSVCGNEYGKPMVVEVEGERHAFECFVCAVSVLAPECEYCGARILGHGLEAGGKLFCCAHFARDEGGQDRGGHSATVSASP